MIKIDLPKMTITIENKFVCTTYKKDVKIERKDVGLFLENLHKNTIEDVPYVMITDVSQMSSISREARDFVAEKGGKRIVKSAIVINGNIQKTLANMFSLFSKPKVETKFFTEIEIAKKWLGVE